MSTLIRSVLLVAIVMAVVAVGGQRSHAAGRTSADDLRLLRTAAVHLRTQPTHAVLRWLGHHPSVRLATLGRDRQTIEVRFRDGLTSAILPSAMYVARVSEGRLRPEITPGAPARAHGGRAAVWEPFADELGLGPHAGDVEVQDLQGAGFQVDQAYNGSVTVASMTTMSRYNVVYMHTHSGLLSDGDGVLASGELATGDPNVQPLLADGSVLVVGVAGSDQQYYAITSRFVAYHMGTFPAHALLFLNGCSLLDAPVFWQALQSKGAGALVSWDADAATTDDYFSAAAFFQYMANGDTVQAAISAVRAAGFGTSSSGGTVAHLGFAGDGSVSLSSGGSAPPPTSVPPTAVPTVPPTVAPTSSPMPPLTSTPRPTTKPTHTPPPTSTTAPRATATRAVPTQPASTPITRPTRTPKLSLAVKLHPKVGPSASQTITIHSQSGARVKIAVRYPDGERLTTHLIVGAGGIVHYRFVQPTGVILHNRSTAVVVVTARRGTMRSTIRRTYRILFARMDVSVEPRAQRPGKSVTVWAHTYAHVRVSLRVVLVKKDAPGGITLTPSRAPGSWHNLETGRSGWIHVRYVVSRHLASGKLLAAVASATYRGHTLLAVGNFTVK